MQYEDVGNNDFKFLFHLLQSIYCENVIAHVMLRIVKKYKSKKKYNMYKVKTKCNATQYNSIFIITSLNDMGATHNGRG